mmetsp:Transcript_8138/g.17710  ORF Transcript_8138/g.17710 Transcript_8138/m.17710 type:complete len:164 (+) Transcript_8138:86-577(+)
MRAAAGLFATATAAVLRGPGVPAAWLQTGTLMNATVGGHPEGDGTCHQQCHDGTHCVLIKSMPNDFCSQSGGPNAMQASGDSSDPDAGTWCERYHGQPWCICKWAFAGTVNSRGCDYVQVDCGKSGTDGISHGVCDAYNEGSSTEIDKAKECIRQQCGAQSGC